MRVAILDDYIQAIQTLECFSLLAEHEVIVVNDYIPEPSELAPLLNNPEALILTRTRTKVDEKLLSLLPDLKVISQTGKNPGHIDNDACASAGVIVLEGRGNPVATAELTWNLIMSGLRQLPQNIASMKDGRWQTHLGRRVKSKTIGIWGFGRIGKKVAAYADAFDAQVMVWGSDSARDLAISYGYIPAASKESFFSTCDVITLHLRLNESTRAIIQKSDLLSMKKDALLVNTARAGLIEPGALLEALQMGRPGYAAVDVYDEEPIFNKAHPLLSLPQVICSPHLGYVEKESFELYFGIAFQNLIDWIKESY